MKRLFLAGWFICCLSAVAADATWVRDVYQNGDFALAQGGQLADVFIAPEDFKCDQIAANLFAEDVGRVTGHKPAMVTDAAKLRGPAVFIGTLGHSPVIDRLVTNGKLDAKQLQGQWESFIIATVAAPLPGVDSAVVIAGSDRRGTAYGVFELSQAIGVSPWYWWADVVPAHRDNLFVAAGTRRFGPPSVQYRGIFINDEDWGLNPWAAKTFEPEVGNIGPKTYAKICELLLRLKANTLWPAMHECSTPFNAIPENKVVADDYGIVMGSSHCEPLLRNNVGEWPADDQASYNFLTNPAGVTKYWEDRLVTNGQYENLYTIGMRGIHDGPMQGPQGEAQIVSTLEQIFDVQRGLLAGHVNPDPAKVPQIFCAYKEVLDYFLRDLRVPPDVTVVFPDDNFGYIRYFPTPAQIAARPGGFGVYYHISYLGAPFSYVWLNTTPPALIWEEMSKAYAHGIQKFWMLNVGDLKPGEIGIDFFMQMAWDINKWNLQTLSNYLTEWAAQQFGPSQAPGIARILNAYYQLGYQRKPEHLQWNIQGEAARASDLTAIDYGDEMTQRRQSYNDLIMRTKDLIPAKAIPPTIKTIGESFYELVYYPVGASASANDRFFAGELANYYLREGAAADIMHMKLSVAGAENFLRTSTDRYNNEILNGKWKNLMPDDVLQSDRSYRTPVWQPPAELAKFQPSGPPGVCVLIEGKRERLGPGESASLPHFDPFTDSKHYIAGIDSGASHDEWSAQPDTDWIKVDHNLIISPDNGLESRRLWFSIDWAKAPKGENVSGNIVITDGKSTFTVTVPIFNPVSPTPAQLAGKFVESDGVVSMEAEHFSRKVDRPGAAWQVIPGLGRTGDAVSVFPTTAPSVEVAQAATNAPVLNYDFYLFKPGDVTIHYNLIPTQPIQYGQGLRFAVALDDAPPQLVTITAGTGGEVGSNGTPAWMHNVLDNSTSTTTRHTIAAAGAHTLKIYMVDPGVLLEKIVIDAGGLRPSYLGPPETLVRLQP